MKSLAPALLTLALVLLALGGRAAWAQAPAPDTVLAIVDLVTEQDDAGRWRAADPASAAFRIRAGAEAPLQAGMDLAVGDTVRADLARVEIRYATGERLNLTEGTTLTLTGERTLLQELGEVYYRLRGAFRVEYGTVETVVEGTRFVVVGEGEPTGDVVRVRVDEGRVRISNGEEEVVLPRGQQVRMPQTGALATPPGKARPTPAEVARSFPHGRPRLVLGAMATGSTLVSLTEPPADLAAVRGTYGVRLSLGVGLGRVLRLAYDTTVIGAGRRGMRLPQDLSLAIALPGTGLAFGGGPSVTYEQCTRACGGRYKAVHIGGAGWVRGSLPLTRRFALTAEGRAGYDSDLRLGGGAGVEVAL